MIRGRSVVELSEADLAYLVGYEAAIAHASQMDDLRAGIEDARRDAA